ncbi:MAG TPA: signal peptide peptidase SppA [Caulobacteraceae bacterium]|nr:signal peptide peptidase SppA [Caulobacteraceae bacterium]
MKQFLITVAGVFVALLLFFIGVPIALLVIAASASSSAATPSDAVLTVDLRGPITDQDSPNPLSALSGGGGTSVLSVIQTLSRAAADDRIKGVIVRLPESGLAPAEAEELRQAVLRFRQSHKPVFAHSQGLYSSGVTTATYMLGAAADQYWMQAGAPFEATGLASEDIFFKRAFDKYGVTADFQQREQFKNAVNPYLFSDYTPAHREAEQDWMNSVFSRTLQNAAADRKLNADILRSTIEAGPYDAAQAASNGLIDRVGEVHEAEEQMKRQVKAASLVTMEDYSASPIKGVSGAGLPTIAVITCEGAIMTGKGGASPFGGDNVYSDEIAKAFYAAAADKSVKAIVFRVSSPGGSDTAAEQIGAAVKAAKAAGKPVVVSMGTYAASGGYWISAGASKIIAQPTTLTGSIGVYGGKFAYGEAAAKFGIDLRQITVGGDYAASTSSAAPFTPAQKAAYAAQIDRVYARFIGEVAQDRKMPVEKVRELAKGRVWTGDEALKLGLVDQLGGFNEAVDEAKKLAGIQGQARLKLLPPRLTLFEALQKAMGVNAESAKTLAAASVLLGDPRARSLIEQLAQARLRAQGANTLAPTPFH